jgi:hypothetical protein
MYSYEAEKPRLFTEDGSVTYTQVRDAVHALLRQAGAFRQDHLRVAGDTWTTLACLDRMVELGELVKLRPEGSCWGQYQVYARPQVHNYGGADEE